MGFLITNEKIWGGTKFGEPRYFLTPGWDGGDFLGVFEEENDLPEMARKLIGKCSEFVFRWC